MSPRGEAPANLGAAAALLALATADLAIAEVYTRIAEQRIPLQLFLAMTAAAALAATAAALLGRSPAPARRPWPSRLLLALAVGIAWMGVIGATPDRWWALFEVPVWTRALVAGVTVGLVALSFTATPALWQRARVAAAAALLLFTLTPPVFGWLQAPALAWPQAFDAGSAEVDRGRTVTMVVLLDELNARQADGLVRAIAARGLSTRMTAVRSVGSRTQNTVPSLFLGRSFDGSEPCAPTMSCDADGAIDFARVQATRPDIDVVGFYKPYCSIQGLRSCVRVPAALRLTDTTALRCRLWRRSGWPLGVDDGNCKRSGVQDWAAMTDAAVEAARQAPTLTQGGLLYLHLPLPHPPADGIEGTVAEQYRQNLDRSAALLSELIGRAQSSGLAPRLLVFSDHPLRQSMWCVREPYLSGRCVIDPELTDEQVPVIAAGAEPPDLSGLDSNLDVFELATQLR